MKNNKKKLHQIPCALMKLGAAAALGLASLSAEATLIGDQVTVTNVFDGSVFEGPSIVTVAAGNELVDYGDIWTIDIMDESIKMTCTGILCGNGVLISGLDEYLFEDLDWVGMTGAVVGVSYDPLSTLTSGLLSFTGDSVKISFAGNTVDPPANAMVLINLQTTHAAVPEPFSLGLLGLGLAGLAATRRRSSV